MSNVSRRCGRKLLLDHFRLFNLLVGASYLKAKYLSYRLADLIICYIHIINAVTVSSDDAITVVEWN